MAFTHVAAHGTANSKTSTFSISLNPTSTIPIGNIAVLWLACDNRAFIGGGGDSTTFRYPTYDNTVTDTAGNQWIQCTGGAPDTPGTGLAAECAIFVVQLTAPLTTSDTVTANFLAPRVAKTIELHEFSHDVRNSWSFTGGGAVRSEMLDPAGFASGSVRQGVYLALHALAAEGPNTDTYTWTAGWTQIAGDGTTGGADDSNIHLRGGYEAFSGVSTPLVNVTSTTTDRSYIEGLVLIGEVDIPEPFGTCDVVDSGSRADENPLSFGGRWSDGGENIAAFPGGVPNPELKLASGEFQVADQTHRDNFDRYYITPGAGCNDYEMYATITTKPSDISTSQTIPLPPTNTGFRGLMLYSRTPGSSFFANGAAYWLRKNRDDPDTYSRWHDVVVVTQNIQVGSQIHTQIDMVDGCKLGLSKLNYELHVWVDRTGSSGWEWIMSFDTGGIVTGSATRKFGMQISGSETRIDDFSFCEECFGPQIYRRVVT